MEKEDKRSAKVMRCCGESHAAEGSDPDVIPPCKSCGYHHSASTRTVTGTIDSTWGVAKPLKYMELRFYNGSSLVAVVNGFSGPNNNGTWGADQTFEETVNNPPENFGDAYVRWKEYPYGPSNWVPASTSEPLGQWIPTD